VFAANSMHRGSPRLIAVGLWLAFLFWGRLSAQTITGTISGAVVDTSGAVVPAAKITLLDEGTGTERASESNVTGLFTFDAVRPGTYTVRVEKQGFRTVQRTHLVLAASERLPVGAIELQVGQTSETVTIRAEGELVKTDSAEHSGLLSATQIDLAIARGRDPINLLKLLPGATSMTGVQGGGENDERSVGNGNQSLGGRYGSWTPNFSGLRINGSNISLDGQPGGDVSLPGLFNETTSMETVAEMKAITSNYAAEYGGGNGAVVSIVTKSGTKDFHGNASTFIRNEAFNANDFFYNRSALKKPAYRYATFGFTAGGPVYIPNRFNADRSKLFFFYGQEHWRITQPLNLIQATVPTALERVGNFSQSLDQNNRLIVINDPTNGQPFPGNIVPANRINPNGQALLNVQPLPNRLDRRVTAGAYNLEWADTVDLPKINQVLRLDYRPKMNHMFYLRGKRWATNARSYTENDGFKGNLPLLYTHYKYTDDSLQLGYTRVFGTAMTNEFNIGIRGPKELRHPAPGEFDSVLKSKAGYTLAQLFPSANEGGLIPAASFGGVPSAGSITYDTRIGTDGGDNVIVVTDNFSFLRGRHNPKLGFMALRLINTEGRRSLTPFSGTFDFGRNVNNPLDSNYAYANAVLGNFSSYTEPNNRILHMGKQYVFEWFAQDTWKVTNRLTLNYGLRFSYFSQWRIRPPAQGSALALERYSAAKSPVLYRPARDAAGQRVGQNPVTGEFVPAPWIGAYVPGTGDVLNGMVTDTAKDYPVGWINHQPVETAPRFGFAYDPFGNGKMAVRGGFGITKQSQYKSNQYTTGIISDPPYQLISTLYYSNMSSLLNSQGVLFPASVVSLEKDMKTPSVYYYSFGIQRDAGWNTVVDLSYVGNFGRHLIQSRNLNTVPFGAQFLRANSDPTNPSQPLPDNFFRPYPGYASITYNEASGTSNYNSLQFGANRRFANGPQIGLTYTYSKAMGLTGDDGGALPMYVSYRVWSYGKLNYDQTHALAFSYVWDLPRASRLLPNAVVRAVFDHWTASGVTTFASGLPMGITLTTTDGANISGGGDGTRVVALQNPLLSRGDRSILKWFNTSAFGRPAVGTFGNAPKDVFRGPGTNNWDITFMKKTPIRGESVYLQYRAELYNAFNHSQFLGVDSTARFDPAGNQVNGRFGQLIASRPPRVIQLAVSLYF